MKKFIKLYKEINKDTHMDMLRNIDIENNIDRLLETEPFEGVEELSVPEYSEDIVVQYFDEDFKLNKKIEILSIFLHKFDGFVQDGYYLKIACKYGTIIKPKK